MVSIIESLVGPLHAEPAPRPLGVHTVGSLSPGELPPALDWVVIAAAHDVTGPVARTMIGHASGLAMAPFGAVDAPVTLVPASADAVRTHAAELVGRPRRSIRDLLAEH